MSFARSSIQRAFTHLALLMMGWTLLTAGVAQRFEKPDLVSHDTIRSLEVRSEPCIVSDQKYLFSPCSCPPPLFGFNMFLLTLQSELDNGASISALRRFNDNLRKLSPSEWGTSSCSLHFYCISRPNLLVTKP